MRSMVPRMRTVSWAEAGKARQIEAKPMAARLRAIPYICNLPDFFDAFSLQHPQSPIIPKRVWNREGHAACNRPAPLFDFDPGVLNHLAPARFLAAHIAVEFRRRTRHHHQALVDAQLLERRGFHRFGGGLVATVD